MKLSDIWDLLQSHQGEKSGELDEIRLAIN